MRYILLAVVAVLSVLPLPAPTYNLTPNHVAIATTFLYEPLGYADFALSTDTGMSLRQAVQATPALDRLDWLRTEADQPASSTLTFPDPVDVLDLAGALDVLKRRQVTGCSNTTPIVVTTGVNHGYVDGAKVTITGVGGNTACNVVAVAIANATATTFELTGIAGNGTYTAGGVSATHSVSATEAAAEIDAGNAISVGNPTVSYVVYDTEQSTMMEARLVQWIIENDQVNITPPGRPPETADFVAILNEFNDSITVGLGRAGQSQRNQRNVNTYMESSCPVDWDITQDPTLCTVDGTIPAGSHLAQQQSMYNNVLGVLQ